MYYNRQKTYFENFNFINQSRKSGKNSANQLLLHQLYKLTVIYPLVDSSEDLLLDFFINYSDKYEIYKGTDLLIFFAILTYIINRSNFTQYNKILYFSGISSLFIPLFVSFIFAKEFSLKAQLSDQQINVLNMFYTFF